MEEEEDDDDVFSSFSHDGIDYNQSKALEVFDSRYNTKLDYNIILYFKTFDYIIIKKMEMIWIIRLIYDISDSDAGLRWKLIKHCAKSAPHNLSSSFKGLQVLIPNIHGNEIKGKKNSNE